MLLILNSFVWNVVLAHFDSIEIPIYPPAGVELAAPLSPFSLSKHLLFHGRKKKGLNKRPSITQTAAKDKHSGEWTNHKCLKLLARLVAKGGSFEILLLLEQKNFCFLWEWVEVSEWVSVYVGTCVCLTLFFCLEKHRSWQAAWRAAFIIVTFARLASPKRRVQNWISAQDIGVSLVALFEWQWRVAGLSVATLTDDPNETQERLMIWILIIKFMNFMKRCWKNREFLAIVNIAHVVQACHLILAMLSRLARTGCCGNAEPGLIPLKCHLRLSYDAKESEIGVTLSAWPQITPRFRARSVYKSRNKVGPRFSSRSSSSLFPTRVQSLLCM